LKSLERLDLRSTNIRDLPPEIGELISLTELLIGKGRFGAGSVSIAGENHIASLPSEIGKLLSLQWLALGNSYELHQLPDSIGQLKELRGLNVSNSRISDLPESIAHLEKLEELNLDQAPLNPELSAAYQEGLEAVKRYLRAKVEAQVVLNEAKLILIGEGNVGKSSLLGALRGDAWIEDRETTHGVEIKAVQVQNQDNGKEISLNAWDFGGQPLYRPTHQLFFTAPAVYLVVWEPRLGPEQCCVNEWIKLVRNRAYDETRPDDRPRILIVATHGGPKERRDHIDQEAIRKQFGNLIVDFHQVDSLTGEGIEALKEAIARTACDIRQIGRTVPASWKRVLDAVREQSKRTPYINYSEFETLCAAQQVDVDLAKTYAAILSELGHLIHYGNDLILKDTVILKPDWLSKAISFVLEDKQVKDQNGLIEHHRLDELWNDPARDPGERYPNQLHLIFRRLMEKFDLSYQVAIAADDNAGDTSLIAQLVPGARPNTLQEYWPDDLSAGDTEKVQICRIVETETSQPARADGLLYRLIVRLHRYSLGRTDYDRSCHWQRGMVLDDRFNGRALIEHIGDDLHVRVRAAYPERLLHHLCEEVKLLVDHFWKGLDCQITVPCLSPCKGVFEIEALLESRREDHSKYPCSVCRKWIEIDSLLSKPAKLPAIHIALAELKRGQAEIQRGFTSGISLVRADLRALISQGDEQFAALIRTLTDEAKEGPRLFSFEPIDPGFFDRPKWLSQKFRVTLWCEHSRLPLSALNGENDKRGVYEFDVPRKWFVQAAPFLKLLTNTLSLVLPVAAAGSKLVLNETTYKAIEDQLDFGKECAEAMFKTGETAAEWSEEIEGMELEQDLQRGEAVRARGAVLRQLQAWLKEKDPGFGGLVRVQNKRQEFLWVHPQFEKEY
jgi:GTPase SAR1 family protein